MASYQPYKLSPVHRALGRLEPVWADMDGWRVASRFRPPEEELQAVKFSAGLCDLSETSKIEYRGRDLDGALPPLLGCGALPAVGAGWNNGLASVYRLTRDEALLCGAPGDQIGKLLSGFEGCLHALDRTSGLAHFLLVGPRAKEVLQRVTDLDVRDATCPNLCCRRGPLAEVSALLIRRDRRETAAYEIMATRDYGEYVWDVLWETGQPLGMSVFGREARLRLEA